MMSTRVTSCALFFFFNDTATTEIYTLSLHDALPILPAENKLAEGNSFRDVNRVLKLTRGGVAWNAVGCQDRKSTRLNSSHANISYAVFCLKKKKKKYKHTSILIGFMQNARNIVMNTY